MAVKWLNKVMSEPILVGMWEEVVSVKRLKTFFQNVAVISLLYTASCNTSAASDKATEFAEDVVLHVVLHEIGHALIREFDLPVLGNEETMADAFATHYLTHHLPDRALDVLTARISSWQVEASEVPRNKWPVKGEHSSDARRAFQTVALSVAADRDKYSALGTQLGFTESDLKNAADYGSEIHRSWRRILRPLMMPEGMESTETRIGVDPGDVLVKRLIKGPLLREVGDVLKRFDWHSQVTVFFVQGDGTAGWSRSKRTVSVYSQYIERFMDQSSQTPQQLK